MSKTSPKELTILPVFKNHIEIASLQRTDRGYGLAFNPEIVGEPVTYQMRATLVPLIENGVNLPPYFANLLPEGLRLKALVKLIKTSEDDLFSLLAASAHDCIGDITFAAESIKMDLPAPKLGQVNFYELFDDSLKDVFHDSISGMQEKISASMIRFPLNLSKNKKRYLLKLNPKDKPNLVANEFACMSVARACGLNVANTQKVIDRDGNEGLLVERFDRKWNDESGGFDFLHQEDGCQILNLYPSQKYRVSINDLAKKIAELVPSPEIEILTLLQWVSFSYLIGNGDLHAKNISLHDPIERLRQLTPAYDLISTCIYGDPKLALKIDGFDDNLTRKLLINFANRFGIPDKAVELMLNKLLQKFTTHGKELPKKIKMSEKEKSTFINLMRKRIRDLKT